MTSRYDVIPTDKYKSMLTIQTRSVYTWFLAPVRPVHVPFWRIQGQGSVKTNTSYYTFICTCAQSENSAQDTHISEEAILYYFHAVRSKYPRLNPKYIPHVQNLHMCTQYTVHTNLGLTRSFQISTRLELPSNRAISILLVPVGGWRNLFERIQKLR